MWVYFVAALIPIVIGFIYYHEAALGKTWMRLNGFTPESLAGGNMAVTLGVSYVLGLLLTYALWQLCIHQTGLFGMMAMVDGFGVEGSDVMVDYQAMMAKYGERHRSFGHGALHGGFVGGLCIAVPVIAINALFERRGWRYIGVHAGYWIVTLAIMGGLLGQFAPNP